MKNIVFSSASGGLRPPDPPLWAPYIFTSGFFFFPCAHPCCCHINKKLRSNLDIEIVYDFCMEIGPCAIGYRCPALVEIPTAQGVVRPVGTESSGRGFFFAWKLAPCDHPSFPYEFPRFRREFRSVGTLCHALLKFHAKNYLIVGSQPKGIIWRFFVCSPQRVCWSPILD